VSHGDPHDKLFKAVFSEPEEAGAWLRGVLPRDVVEALNFKKMRLESGEFVDRSLNDRHSDLLFSTCWKDGSVCLLYVLIEHQSTPDPMMAFRIARYIVRIWERWQEKPENKYEKQLPMVLPVVVYHGERYWKAGGLEALVKRPEGLEVALGNLVPQLDYQLVNLRTLSDDQIPGRALGRLTLMMLRNVALGHNLWRLLFQWGWLLDDAWRESGERAIELLLSYIYRVNEEPDEGEVRAFLAENLQPTTREVFVNAKKTAAEKWFEEGLETGLEKGLKEGRVAGRAEGREKGQQEGIVLGLRFFLLKSLERQFGTLEPWHIVAVQTAERTRLEQIIERQGGAETLDEVFSE